MIAYNAWCAICGAPVCTPEEWKNHKHPKSVLSLEEIEYDNPHFSPYEYEKEE